MFMKKLKEVRNGAGLSQKALAERLSISQQAYAKYENGTASPNPETIKKLSEILNVSADYLLGTETNIAPEEQNAMFLEKNNVYMLPLYANASAGFGTSANNEVLEQLPCYIKSKAEAENSLCIKVVGDSMYPKIEEGDILQVHKQDSVDSGAIAVVLLDKSDGYVKKIVYGEDWIELHSINPMYPVQRFEGKDAYRIEVVGLVKKIIKNV